MTAVKPRKPRRLTVTVNSCRATAQNLFMALTHHLNEYVF